MKKLLIANRGEIARRILRAGRERGYCVAVVATEEDSDSLVCSEVDAVLKVSSFLDPSEIVAAASAWKADLIHPGYGFLSENSEFADLVERAGITFVGPTAANIMAMGSKESAKRVAERCQVPVLGALFSADLAKIPETGWAQALQERNIRAPYLVKASAGGGGRGMRVVEKFEDLPANIHRASEEAKASFRDGTVFIENYLQEPRHIEIQVFGDGNGGGVFLGERECSLQRRHQKVVEEAPSPVVDVELREQMGKAALALVRETKYRGAGTAEFLLDAQGQFYFLEMNTRLQVEHPVTEIVFGVDLVHAQLDLAEGRWPKSLPDPKQFVVLEPRGVALEARILAENPRENYLPTPGPLLLYREPKGEGVRVDTGVSEGKRVNSNYDSMIAKLICFGKDRAEATARLSEALSQLSIAGTVTNIPFLQAVVRHPDFLVGNESTAWLGAHQNELMEEVIPKNLRDLFTSSLFAQKLFEFRVRPSSATSAGQTPQKVFAGLGGLTACLHPSAGDDLRIKETDLLRKVEISGEALNICLRREKPRRHFCSAINDAIRDACFDRAKIEAYVTPAGQGECYLTVSGENILIKSHFSEGHVSEGAAESAIRAPMAGKVLEIHVKEGDVLAAGRVAFVVESMKMQLEVRAKSACRVDRILVKVGQVLTGPDTMAQVSSEDKGA